MKGKLKCVYFSYYGSPGDVLNMNTSKVKENVLCRNWETCKEMIFLTLLLKYRDFDWDSANLRI